MAKMINSVCGPISTDDLGKVLIHEHLTFQYPGLQGDTRFSDQDHEARKLQIAVETLEQLKQQGYNSFVEATPNECGRNPEFYKRVSEITGMNIICSAGYYFEAGGAPNYFKNTSSLGYSMEYHMYDLFEKEISNGIGNTGIKPGVLKAASSNGEITPYEEALTRTLGRIAVKYDIPVLTHTQNGTMGSQQADILMEEGMKPEKILIGHSCDSTDMNYLMELAEKGVYIGYDRWGLQGFYGSPTDDVKLASFMGLMRAGFLDQLMCSHDYNIVDYYMFWSEREPIEINPLLSKWHPAYFMDEIVPKLKMAGVTDREIDIILEENPKNFFC